MATIYDKDYGQVTLTLDDDSELVCDILAIYPVGDKKYIAMTPEGGDENSDIFLYRYEGDEESEDEDMQLIDIESDEEFEAASDAFYELCDDAEFQEILDEDDA